MSEFMKTPLYNYAKFLIVDRPFKSRKRKEKKKNVRVEIKELTTMNQKELVGVKKKKES